MIDDETPDDLYLTSGYILLSLVAHLWDFLLSVVHVLESALQLIASIIFSVANLAAIYGYWVWRKIVGSIL